SRLPEEKPRVVSAAGAHRTSAGKAEFPSEAFAVGVERGRETDRRLVPLQADRRRDEGDAARADDRREGPRRFRTQRLEGPSDGADRDCGGAKAGEPGLARLRPEDLGELPLEDLTVGEPRLVRAEARIFRPLRTPDEFREPGELPVGPGGHDE